MTEWLKQLRERYAASTVVTLRTILSMITDDAVDERLIPANPVRRRRRRGRRRDHAPTLKERVWAMPEQVLRIAEQATMLGGRSAGLLVITTAWTGCRWGEIAGLQRDHVDLDRGVITIDPDIGALHESAHRQWLGPPKTPASARTIKLPPFLTAMLREHLADSDGSFVFTSPRGFPLWRGTFDRRVFRPAVDGDHRKGTRPIRPGLTFHGLRPLPQDLADRRWDPGDCPGKAARPPSVEPAGRGLQPRRPGDRDQAPTRAGAAVEASHHIASPAGQPTGPQTRLP